MEHEQWLSTCRSAYFAFRGLRWVTILFLLVAILATIAALPPGKAPDLSEIPISQRYEVIRSLNEDRAAMRRTATLAGIGGLAHWMFCTLAMAVAAGAGACVKISARDQERRQTTGQSRQPVQLPPAPIHHQMESAPQPRADVVLGQRPGESLEAWAARVEQSEIAAFKAKTKT